MTLPILRDTKLSPESYKLLVSLALSVLQSVSETEDDIEETRSAETAAKVLPELINVRPGETERVSRALEEFYPKMKKLVSKQNNQELKQSLQDNKSIPASMKEALGLEVEGNFI